MASGINHKYQNLIVDVRVAAAVHIAAAQVK